MGHALNVVDNQAAQTNGTLGMAKQVHEKGKTNVMENRSSMKLYYGITSAQC